MPHAGTSLGDCTTTQTSITGRAPRPRARRCCLHARYSAQCYARQARRRNVSARRSPAIPDHSRRPGPCSCRPDVERTEGRPRIHLSGLASCFPQPHCVSQQDERPPNRKGLGRTDVSCLLAHLIRSASDLSELRKSCQIRSMLPAALRQDSSRGPGRGVAPEVNGQPSPAPFARIFRPKGHMNPSTQPRM